MITPTDLAWAAGIIDGEGCVHILRNKHYVPSVSYILRVTVVNTDPRMLRKLQDFFGGNIMELAPRDVRHKRQWVWQVNSARAQRVLEQVRPYLVIKGEQADIGLLARTYARPRGKRLDINPNNEKLEGLYQEIKQLKRTVH